MRCEAGRARFPALTWVGCPRLRNAPAGCSGSPGGIPAAATVSLVENTIRMVSYNVSFKAVHASRGKVTRAEPISALYEQRQVHHVGTFTQLEDQMCSFTSDFDRSRSGYSPDRLDAAVWGLSELAVSDSSGRMTVATMFFFKSPPCAKATKSPRTRPSRLRSAPTPIQARPRP